MVNLKLDNGRLAEIVVGNDSEVEVTHANGQIIAMQVRPKTSEKAICHFVSVAGGGGGPRHADPVAQCGMDIRVVQSNGG